MKEDVSICAEDKHMIPAFEYQKECISTVRSWINSKREGERGRGRGERRREERVCQCIQTQSNSSTLEFSWAGPA